MSSDPQEPPKKKPATGFKRGPKAGSVNTKAKKTVMDWFVACETFEKMDPKPSHKSFLASDASSKCFTGTQSEKTGFVNKLKEFRAGTLKPPANAEAMRRDTTKFDDVEQKLIAHLNLRAKRFQRGKCGTSWKLMQEKSLEFAKRLGHSDFKASDGWLHKTLK